MTANSAASIGLTDCLATHDITPAFLVRDTASPFGPVKSFDMSLSETLAVRDAHRTKVAQRVSAESVARRSKLAASRDNLNVIENCLFAVFVGVVAILATIVLAVTASYTDM